MLRNQLAKSVNPEDAAWTRQNAGSRNAAAEVLCACGFAAFSGLMEGKLPMLGMLSVSLSHCPSLMTSLRELCRNLAARCNWLGCLPKRLAQRWTMLDKELSYVIECFGFVFCILELSFTCQVLQIPSWLARTQSWPCTKLLLRTEEILLCLSRIGGDVWELYVYTRADMSQFDSTLTSIRLQPSSNDAASVFA